ncbi:hypothetical protein N7495_009280 [Penicillium taxi]|uniref:uncharacterized protein n=1 Tax=Penicillium taxi TaxID=168475 RepID=UPI002544F624|nr:uncharacterized protein N7495_009280 [Penicillium taxi]KAJ5884770.1 hypothetical protein N7495_009280 [Penicillium taxi]
MSDITMSSGPLPSDDEFWHLLQKSLTTWSSYVGDESENAQLLPRQAIDLKPLVRNTPSYLGHGVGSSGETISFSCEERNNSLLIKGRSTWKTSKGQCDLQPKVLPKQLQLAVSRQLSVRLSKNSPLSNWPGVQGLSKYDKGNYLSVLFFAWSYILSARWVELLNRSTGHECQLKYTTAGVNDILPQLDEHLAVDVGDIPEEECLWWRAILCPEYGWNATTKYNDHLYVSPWSASSKDIGFTLSKRPSSPEAKLKPPSSTTALKYLSRFCIHHCLYGQCSAALAGVLYIPFLGGRELFLPFPKKCSQLEKAKVDLADRNGSPSVSIPELLKEHRDLLPKYMTLSSNVWGLRSLLVSTFFNPEIECNLASAWLNPAFAVIDSIQSTGGSLATFLAKRQPRLGILWLGAIITDVADSVLSATRNGRTALDISASVWTGTTQTFLTASTITSGRSNTSISRDDECRLSFITSLHGQENGQDRLPACCWKPFGETQLCDTEPPVRLHAQCGDHCLEYESWEWLLANDRSIQESVQDSIQDIGKDASETGQTKQSANTSLGLGNYNHQLFSQEISEGATVEIFSWLRSTGYPVNERPIYQSSWFAYDWGEYDGEVNQAPVSGVEKDCTPKIKRVENWLENVC